MDGSVRAVVWQDAQHTRETPLSFYYKGDYHNGFGSLPANDPDMKFASIDVNSALAADLSESTSPDVRLLSPGENDESGLLQNLTLGDHEVRLMAIDNDDLRTVINTNVRAMNSQTSPVLYNDWITSYGLSDSDSLPLANPHSGSLSNFMEYVLGGDPTNANDDEEAVRYTAHVSFSLNALRVDGQDSVSFIVTSTDYDGNGFSEEFAYNYGELGD